MENQQAQNPAIKTTDVVTFVANQNISINTDYSVHSVLAGTRFTEDEYKSFIEANTARAGDDLASRFDKVVEKKQTPVYVDPSNAVDEPAQSTESKVVTGKRT